LAGSACVDAYPRMFEVCRINQTKEVTSFSARA
jgi:hypothetical protein